MNKPYILHNLREALSELQRTIADIESRPDYGYGEYVVNISHVYHHINTAWNARDVSEEEAIECSERNFNKWRMFPDCSELHIEQDN